MDAFFKYLGEGVDRAKRHPVMVLFFFVAAICGAVHEIKVAFSEGPPRKEEASKVSEARPPPPETTGTLQNALLQGDAPLTCMAYSDIDDFRQAIRQFKKSERAAKFKEIVSGKRFCHVRATVDGSYAHIPGTNRAMIPISGGELWSEDPVIMGTGQDFAFTGTPVEMTDVGKIRIVVTAVEIVETFAPKAPTPSVETVKPTARFWPSFSFGTKSSDDAKR